MARYSVEGTDALVADDTVLGIVGGTTARPRVYDIILSSPSSPNDYSAHFHFQRTTTAGTSTAVTPQPLDSDERAAVATAGEAHTAEPTYTAGEVLLNISHNQRATVRWVAAPGGELVVPATANNGLGQRCIAVSTQFTEDPTWYFEE